MHQVEIKAIFDQQAASYDTQWAKTATIKDCLYFILASLFTELRADAQILCVGVGTGAELAQLAQKNPAWRFTAVEPSGLMLDVCRKRAETEGFASRCYFHEGYLDSLSATEPHDAATCFLVSQFILDQQARSGFFREISRKLKSGGILASSDLASDVESSEYEVLLRAWMNMMAASDISPDLISAICQHAPNTGTSRKARSGQGGQRAAAISSRGSMALRSKRRLNRYWASAKYRSEYLKKPNA